MASSVESSSSAPAFNSEEVAKLMGQGKRHYVCSEITQAVKCFEEVCEALGKHYGEMADECGDAYLCYGKALLDLVRMESNAIGTAFQEAPDEEDGSDVDIEEELNTEPPKIKKMTAQEKEEILKNVLDAMTVEKEKQTEGDENLVTKNKESPSKEDKKSDEKPQEPSQDEKNEQTITESTEKDDNKKEKSVKESDGDESNQDTDKNGDDNASGNAGDDASGDAGDDASGDTGDDDASGDAGDNDASGNAGGEGDEDGDSEAAEKQPETEEVSNIQLAWEILELARIIFERQEGKEACLHSAQCHLKLGEIKMEQEYFDDAITDLMKCLELQKLHLESDDRLLAETLYNIGLCHNFQSKFDKSKEAFSDALNVIKLRMENLEKRVAESESKSKGKGKAEADDPAVIDRKELDELKEVYPEIKAKVDDANEMMINAGSVEKELKGQTTNGFSASSSDDKPATLIAVKKVPKEPANDISHLVKKVNKRKPEEEIKESSEKESQPKKKLRQENEEDASPDTAENKDSNGTDMKESTTATTET